MKIDPTTRYAVYQVTEYDQAQIIEWQRVDPGDWVVLPENDWVSVLWTDARSRYEVVATAKDGSVWRLSQNDPSHEGAFYGVTAEEAVNEMITDPQMEELDSPIWIDGVSYR